MAKTLLLGTLTIVTLAFVAFWIGQLRQQDAHSRSPAGRFTRRASAPALGAIGFVTDFLDTLGIGSFATTTTMYRTWKVVEDQYIPGTLNVGHALPTVAQALIYITIVDVEIRTLVLLIAAAVAGSWLGAAVVSGLPRRAIQSGMGMALLVAAALMLATAIQESSRATPDSPPAIQLLPLGGTALGLSGPTLVLGCIINFLLGVLMTLGIGLYAPCIIMVSLLGMNPTAAFPIMMGSCAFLMPVASVQFIRRRRYDLRAAIGLMLGGIPAVLIAAFIVRSLPLNYVRWLVVFIVVFAGASLLRSSMRSAGEPPSVGTSPAHG